MQRQSAFESCVIGDFEEASAVHFNFPLLSFSLYIAFKSGLPLPVSLFLWNRGGLVNGAVALLKSVSS